MSKFTPGPWEIEKSIMYGHYKIVTFIKSFNKDSTGIMAIDSANTRLISKAPDMYDVLRDLLNVIDPFERGDVGDQIVNRAVQILKEIDNE